LRAIAGLDNVDWKVYIFAGWKVSFSTLDFLRSFFFSLYLLTVVGSVVNGVPLSPFLFISVRFLSERASD